MQDLYKKILLSDRVALSKGITLIESTKVNDRKKAEELIKKLYKKSGNSLRIGISGPPGVGKSTFIETLGLFLIKKKNNVAVLAVDPSSKKSGGSILGDKTRMQELSISPSAFIRPSPSEGELGGVAKRTRETMILTESAGYNIILVETVGVGQSETTVAEMVDMFIVLLQPGSGDELQGIKKGIIEIADLLIVNKEDELKSEVERTVSEYKSALSLLNKNEEGFVTSIVKCSSLEKKGIDKIWKIINDFYSSRKKNGWLKKRRSTQLIKWMWEDLKINLFDDLKKSQKLFKKFSILEAQVLNAKISPMEASKKILQEFIKNNKRIV